MSGASCLRDDLGNEIGPIRVKNIQGNISPNSSGAGLVKIDWSEIVDSGSEPSSGSDSDNPIEIFDRVVSYNLVSDSGSPILGSEELISNTCSCFYPKTDLSALSIMEECLHVDPNFNNYNCIIDNFSRCMEKIVSRVDVLDPFKVAAVDLFFRFRHEFLFKSLCLAYNLPLTASDVSFREFGIDSDRTPDLIIEVDNKLIIIEVTASSNFERAAQSKGIEKMGFEGKYKKETGMLNDKGIYNIYVPIFFDMSSPTNEIQKDQYLILDGYFKRNDSFFVLLSVVSKNLCILTNDLKRSFPVPASILFSDVIEIKKDHSSHEFLYRSIDAKTKEKDKVKPNPKYREICISPQVYNKVNNTWTNFYWMVDNCSFDNNSKLIFVLSTNGHRFSIIKDSSGSILSEIKTILDNNDKIGFFKICKLRVGNKLIPCINNESGIRFFEKVVKEDISLDEKPYTLNLFVNHSPLIYKNESFDIKKYEDLTDKCGRNIMISNYYDESYEDVMIKSITEFDKSDLLNNNVIKENSLLGTMKSSSIEIELVMGEIEVDYFKTNVAADSLPVKILKMKSPFILPLADLNQSSYCSLDYKNLEWLRKLSSVLDEQDPYTQNAIDIIISENFKFYENPKAPSTNLNNLIKSRHKLSNLINLLQKKAYKSGTCDKIVRISKTQDPRYKLEFLTLKSDISKLNKEIKNLTDKEGVKNEASLIRLSTKGKGSLLKSMFDKEMCHFKDRKKQSTIEGVGIRSNFYKDFEIDKNVFNEICNFLVMNKGENPDLLIDLQDTKDCNLLSDLKSIAKSEYKDLIKDVKNSSLGHACSFVSRVAHSLLYYSQLPYSSDYLRADNLGYKNCLIIIKGGKKIFKSKSSKLYRLIYPIPDCTMPWYKHGHSNTGSYKFFNYNGVTYCITPWSLLHESILTDSISFYSRVCSFSVLNSNPKISFKDQFKKISLNVLLSFHNRRQTEELLANLRYILLSTMGDYTGVEVILKEFFGFNYDCFQAFIRGCILYNYPIYFNALNKLKKSKGDKEINSSDFLDLRLDNIFNGTVISSVEDLTIMIYSTFLMTKAPYQRSIERSNNLKGILKIHDYYINNVGPNLTPLEQLETINIENTGDYNDYISRLFENDFNIDAKYCSLVGSFIDSIFISNNEVDSLQSSWINILNSTWDEMATSTGLRGDYDKIEDFWGQKGYFVIYKELLKNSDFVLGFKELLNSSLTDDDKRKLVRKLNEIYSDRIEPDREFLIFHAVDKIQWRGGREIYVMDITTKTMQQPIEKFLSEICKKLDNELISIPSDRRAQVIHHSIFEKDLPMKEMLTWYLTLDCTKWAPKSVFVKFILTFLSMSSLPSSFKVHFLNYMEKLYKKRIYFNVKEVEVLTNNSLYKPICDSYLKFDKKVNGYYLEMQYSWVMGIFNYTSSFLHSANQKYFSYLLSKTSLISFKEETSIVMFAHSDDSGGRVTAGNDYLLQRALILYEVNLKACNHLLSKKKSVVSRIYFEILSVIYLFKKLLALLPKFLGGIRFLPTDKGPCQDMLQSYSKSVEVMVAGANFSIAYLVMKFYSTLVWRFYNHNKQITQNDYKRPVQYLGVPDAHPLMVLLCGSDSDILRIMEEKEDLKNLMAFCQSITLNSEGEGPIKSFKFEIKVRGIKKDFEVFIKTFESLLSKWSIKNVNYHNTPLNTLSFLRKLNDSGFVGSLVNESTTRRLSRCYFMRSGNSAITKYGNLKLKSLMDVISLFQSFNSTNNSMKEIMSELLSDSDVDLICEDIKNKTELMEPMYKVLQKTLQSPLKICKYMDQLSMAGRKFNSVFRTLKPTQVQLVKTAQVFSGQFEPSNLVSYICEPELRWALPNIRGIISAKQDLENFCNKNGLDMSIMDPDVMLKICRIYGKESIKSIYLYSRVPTELRQIKSYSAFLTFLAVNTFDDKEISGLTLKLSNKEVGKEYLDTNINDEVYTVNNMISLISVLVNKCDVDFVKNLTINEIQEIDWVGGSVVQFLNHINTWFNNEFHYTFIKPQMGFLLNKLKIQNLSAEHVKGGAFYSFTKRQRVRGGWYGKGEVCLCIDNSFYLLCLYNSRVEEVVTNQIGKIPNHHSDFIKDVCEKINIDFKCFQTNKKMIGSANKMGNLFGVDNTGHLGNFQYREIEGGVPCKQKLSTGTFIENISHYTFSDMYNDVIVVKTGFEGDLTYRKIYFLPIKKTELFSMAPRVLNKKEFDDKLETIGLNSFEEFLMTEVMTEYGANTYVDFNDFIDNYQSSKIYKIYKECIGKSLSTIPKRKNKDTILPAQSGSMSRILIDYTTSTKDQILKIQSNLNPVVMQLRSEYPDQMSLILSEKLIDYHNNIYTMEERKEITEHYNTISDSDNLDNSRNSLIKLMTYWGYGSLVNSITNFGLIKESRNYMYFNCGLLNSKYIKHYVPVFIHLIKSINSTMIKWSAYYTSLDVPVKSIQLKGDMKSVIDNFLLTICLELYKFRTPFIATNLDYLRYMNVLQGLLQEEEFTADLQQDLSKNYILSSIIVNFQNRISFMVLLNTMYFCWSRENKCNFDLDYSTRLQRLPDNIPSYRSYLRSFEYTLPPADVYYHGFLDLDNINKIIKSYEISCNNISYRVSSRISKKSVIRIPMSESFVFKRPIKSSVLDSDDWDELKSEFEMEDLDIDTVEEIISNMGEIYSKPVNKLMKISGQKIVRANITWIIDPNCSSQGSNLGYYRQCGENIVILTNIFISSFLKCYPNSGFRIIGLGRGKYSFAFYSFQNLLNKKDFIDSYLGKSSINLDNSMAKSIGYGLVRDVDGEVKNSTSIGLKSIDLISSEKKIEEVDGLVRIVKKDKTPKPEISNSVRSKYEIVNEKIESLHESLSKETILKLQNKYLKKAVKDGVPTSVILRSIAKESDLNLLNESITLGKADISTTDQKKMFLSPEYFGLAHGLNKNDKNSIKDKKVRAELNSFFEDLSSLIGSGNLIISKSFKKFLESQYSLWIMAYKNTNQLKENKHFLLTSYLAILNSSIIGEDESLDKRWQILANKITVYMTKSNSDSDLNIEDELEESDLERGFNVKSSSVLIYKLEGT